MAEQCPRVRDFASSFALEGKRDDYEDLAQCLWFSHALSSSCSWLCDGNGVAIPHARTEDLKGIYIMDFLFIIIISGLVCLSVGFINLCDKI
jgi:hypothetical protein